MGSTRFAPCARLVGMAMLAAGCGCALPPKKLGTFGLASTEGRPRSFLRIGPAEGVACGFDHANYAAAVEDALRRRPPANALLDARLTASLVVPCWRVEGLAVVID
jgi:hypothetical protein